MFRSLIPFISLQAFKISLAGMSKNTGTYKSHGGVWLVEVGAEAYLATNKSQIFGG